MVNHLLERAIKDQEASLIEAIATRPAKTIAKSVDIEGVGLHKGAKVKMTLRPADPGTGIIFRRIDLPKRPCITASVRHVEATCRCTTLGSNGAVVHTTEHLLSAIKGLGIDNLEIEMDAAEPPVADGCAGVFTKILLDASPVEQKETIPVYALSRPVYVTEGEVHMCALPSKILRLSYTLHYPETPLIGTQYYSTHLNPEIFEKELAPARSFALFREIEALQKAGLIQGASLDSGIVVKDDKILSTEPLRFPDEFVRHKVLDMMGDLALIGFDLKMHVIAIKGGHTSNIALARKIVELTRDVR